MKRTKISRADLAKYPHLQKRIEKEAALVQRDTAPAPAPAPETKEPESKWKRLGSALGSAARGMHSGMKQYGEWVDKKNKEYTARMEEEEKEARKRESPAKKKHHTGEVVRYRDRDEPRVVVIRDRERDRDDEPRVIVVRQPRDRPRKQPRVVVIRDDEYDDEEDEEYYPVIKRKSPPKKKSHPADDIFDSDATLEFLGYDTRRRR